jgi:hypothetical protein
MATSSVNRLQTWAFVSLGHPILAYGIQFCKKKVEKEWHTPTWAPRALNDLRTTMRRRSHVSLSTDDMIEIQQPFSRYNTTIDPNEKRPTPAEAESGAARF